MQYNINIILYLFSLLHSIYAYYIMTSILVERLMKNNYISLAENVMPKTMSPDLLKALQGVCYIAQHIKDADKDKEVN